MKQLMTFLAIGSLTLGGCASTSETDDGGSDKAVTGAIIGGILGGVVANNSGKQSSGKTAMGVIGGAAAGGVIGHQFDKKETQLKQIAAERNASEMEVERVRKDLLKVSVSSEASFGVDETSIKPAFRPTLKKVAEVLRGDSSQRIQVVGHTDSTGSDEYNQALSLKRARVTKSFLVKQGVESSQISVEGRGESEPRADNATAAGRAQNRRVEIFLQQL